MNYKPGIISLSVMMALAAGVSPAAFAQSGLHARTLITRAVNENELTSRVGNVHPAVSWAQDLGKMADDRLIEHMRLQLQRSPEDEARLEAYLDELQNPKSANFHKWGTAAQIVQNFGLAQADIEAVENWLTSRGLTVNFVTPNMTIDFSGTAGAVGQAFHTEIHNLNADGERHFANVTDPKIPAALADAVLGPVALHDFKPRKQTTKVKPPIKQYTVNADYQLVVPGDLATIYNYNPLYSAGISGQGQTVVLLERTDLYATGDWNTFRKVFGLTKSFPKGKLVTVHPQPTGTGTTENGVAIAPETCSDPGVVVGDDGEAAVDVEWASASAPSATIELAS